MANSKNMLTRLIRHGGARSRSGLQGGCPLPKSILAWKWYAYRLLQHWSHADALSLFTHAPHRCHSNRHYAPAVCTTNGHKRISQHQRTRNLRLHTTPHTTHIDLPPCNQHRAETRPRAASNALTCLAEQRDLAAPPSKSDATRTQQPDHIHMRRALSHRWCS